VVLAADIKRISISGFPHRSCAMLCTGRGGRHGTVGLPERSGKISIEIEVPLSGKLKRIRESTLLKVGAESENC